MVAWRTLRIRSLDTQELDGHPTQEDRQSGGSVGIPSKIWEGQTLDSFETQENQTQHGGECGDPEGTRHQEQGAPTLGCRREHEEGDEGFAGAE